MHLELRGDPDVLLFGLQYLRTIKQLFVFTVILLTVCQLDGLVDLDSRIHCV